VSDAITTFYLVKASGSLAQAGSPTSQEDVVGKYFRILFSHPTPLRFLTARVLSLTGVSRAFKSQHDGFALRFYPSNISEQLWIDPNFRRAELDFFYRYVRSGDKIVDVGANIGDTALVCALRAGTKGKVWAIEPHPITFQYLQGNIDLNRVTNIHPVNAAVGENRRKVAFGNSRRDDMNRVGEEGIVVEMYRLDELITDDARLALLKIDVEGYELPVLLGCPKVLSRSDCVYFESCPSLYSTFGYSMLDILSFLEKTGFRLFRKVTGAGLMAIDRKYDTVGDNLIAARDPSNLASRTGWPLL
jgi:FkbM family methyltransferase